MKENLSNFEFSVNTKKSKSIENNTNTDNTLKQSSNTDRQAKHEVTESNKSLNSSDKQAITSCDFAQPITSYIAPYKFTQLKNALKSRSTNIIIVSGPSGYLKSTFINYVLNEQSLVAEYFEDITNYKNKLLSKNAICLTDLDEMDFLVKNKTKLNQMTNLIIETRHLLYMHKFLSNAINIDIKRKTINSNTLSNRCNFHLLPFSYSFLIPKCTIYEILNKLFLSTSSKITIQYDYKIVKYLFSNSINFIEQQDLFEVYDAISLASLQIEELLDYSVYKTAVSSKRKTNNFIKYSSWVYTDHYMCNKTCEDYKKWNL